MDLICRDGINPPDIGTMYFLGEWDIALNNKAQLDPQAELYFQHIDLIT